MAEYEPTPGAVEAFKRAWHEADAEGDEGNRVSRGLAAALAHHDAELRAEVERLREGIEALATEGEAWGRGVAVELSKRLRALLAGSGERSGEVYGPRPTGCCGKCPPIEGGGYDCTCEGNPRCVRERVRDVFVNAERRESFGGTDIDALTDAVLAVVGQGVTDCNCGFGGQHDPANPRCRANRDAVRPSGKEGL